MFSPGLIRGTALVTALLAAVAIVDWHYLHYPLRTHGEAFSVLVLPGASLNQVVSDLNRRTLLRQPHLFNWHARAVGLHLKLIAGRYLLPGDSSPLQLIRTLRSLPNVHEEATLVEGWTLAQARAELHANYARATLVGLVDRALLKRLGITGFRSAEGLFFPDTYHYATGVSEELVLRQAHLRMMELLSEEWEARSPEQPYETAYQALIAASIIERETGLSEERGQIAGVIARRLQRGMRLEMDPTVAYGLGDALQGKLTRTHLADARNPYNTYRHAGLPPTPICLPSRASIHAALNPVPGDSLYFVARGDGSHRFSATLAQHKAAVRSYRASLKQ